MDQTAVIETEGLIKDFKGFRAVDDVNLKVKRGSIHALIGPNGAGKTTCFNLITKFLQPTAGHIRLNGRDITRTPPAAVANAIARAIGVRVNHMPMTPERVLAALRRQDAGPTAGRT